MAISKLETFEGVLPAMNIWNTQVAYDFVTNASVMNLTQQRGICS